MRTNHREIDREEVGAETLGKYGFIRAMGKRSRGEIGGEPPSGPIQIGEGSILRKCGLHNRREVDVYPFNVNSPESGAKKILLCQEGTEEFLKNAKANVEGWSISTVKKRGVDKKLVLDAKL